RRAAIASLRQSRLPERHLRRPRNHEICALQFRAPVASVLAAVARLEDRKTAESLQCAPRTHDCGPWLANFRTSIGLFGALPPGPGAADTRPAISQARSGVATSTIQ